MSCSVLFFLNSFFSQLPNIYSSSWKPLHFLTTAEEVYQVHSQTKVVLIVVIRYDTCSPQVCTTREQESLFLLTYVEMPWNAEHCKYLQKDKKRDVNPTGSKFTLTVHISHWSQLVQEFIVLHKWDMHLHGSLWSCCVQ